MTLSYIKRIINNAETLSLEAWFEAIHHTRAGEIVDHKEAAKAFVEKRKPMLQHWTPAAQPIIRRSCRARTGSERWRSTSVALLVG